MSEKEIIENVKKQIEHTKKANECGLATKDEFKEDAEALQGLLDLYRKNKNKTNNLISYIAIKECKDFEEVEREFEI